jgi:HD superfamily phosphohydrolase
MLYPGAMHTRFEHSLGVMHTASRMFDQVEQRGRDTLRSLRFTQGGLERDKMLVRVAALLHDVGHPPFSHAGEEDLFPLKEGGKSRYTHEEYSAALVRHCMADVLDEMQDNFAFKAEDVAQFIEGNPLQLTARRRFWRQLLSSQLDADRADYLLRDSHHIGVEYGKYDLERLLFSLTVAIDDGSPVLVIQPGGLHAAESLIVARFMMFTQVYFHRVRAIYDFHIVQAMKSLLADAQKDDATITEKAAFPPPTSKPNLEKYLTWTDWRVLGLLAQGMGGEDGEILRTRQHHREVYSTPEVADPEDFTRLIDVTKRLGTMVAHVGIADKSWYKTGGGNEILIGGDKAISKPIPLSRRSPIARNIGASNQRRLYVPYERREEADEIVKNFNEEMDAPNDKDEGGEM